MLTIDEKQKTLCFPEMEEFGYNSIETLVCEDPYCNCGNGNLLISNKDNNKAQTPENAALVGINFHKEKLFYNDNIDVSEEAKERTQKTLHFFQNNLVAEDWEMLSNLGYYQKMMSIEVLQHDEQYTYQFSEEQQDLNLKISFEEIYPACERFGFTDNNDDLYEIIDLHCKKPNCNCGNLTILVYKNNEIFYEFDYSFSHQVISNGVDDVNILGGMKKKYPQLDMRFAKRNELIKGVTHKNLGSNANSGGLLKKIKVGRNAPCPCGSGKKYKRCCLKK
ncbi:MAG: YecA family protein [Chitinophagales bacterium]